MRIAMQRASTCDALSYLATRSSTLNDPEILSKQPGPPLSFSDRTDYFVALWLSSPATNEGIVDEYASIAHHLLA